MQSTPQDDPNSFAKTMKDMEDQFYATFPAARVAMLQKLWQLQNGYSDPLIDFVYAYDPNPPSPIAQDRPQPAAPMSTSLQNGGGPGYDGSTAYNHSVDPASSHSATSEGQGYPSGPSSGSSSRSLHPQTSLPDSPMGFSATYPAAFRSSSLSAAVVPVDGGGHGRSYSGPIHGHDQHQEQPQFLSAPIVPSNDSAASPVYPHLQSPASSSGWSQSPSMSSLDEAMASPHHYIGTMVPSNAPNHHHLAAKPGPFTHPHPQFPHTQYHHHHHRYNSSSSSSSSAMQSTYGSVTHQYQHLVPSPTHGLNASVDSNSTVSSAWSRSPPVVPSNADALTYEYPSPPSSEGSPAIHEMDEQAASQAVLPAVGPSTASVISTSGSKSGKKNSDKKPPLACLFCRGRKIACGPPVPGGDGHTCNQCHRRSLKCEYPAESRRGMRRKRSATDLEGEGTEARRSPPKAQKTRR